MKTVAILLIILVGLGVVFSLYVRLAPSEPEEWHVTLSELEVGDQAGGAVRRLPAEDETLEKLDAIIRATPRTVVLAGSIEGARLTYVTRSAVFGFPDYTTVEQAGDMLVIYGRLRFGRSDLGVNAKRIDGWLYQL